MKMPRVAVFPVAGLGTRFLPFTKSVPKELLPLNGRPVLEFAVSEAKKAGIKRFVFVNSPEKPQLEAHFRAMPGLETQLYRANKLDALKTVLATDLGDRLAVVHQKQPKGLGHAVLCARRFIGGDPFAVLLPDDFIHSDEPVLAQMIEAYRAQPGNYVATQDVGVAAIGNYGCLDIAGSRGRVLSLKGLVEKPNPLDAPSTFAVVGRYILQPEVMAALSVALPSINDEIDLTEAIAAQETVFGFRFEGSHYDCGQPAGYAAANSYMTSYRGPSKILRYPVREQNAAAKVTAVVD